MEREDVTGSKFDSNDDITEKHKQAVLNELEQAPSGTIATCHKEREAGDPNGSPMERDDVTGSKRDTNAAITRETLRKKQAGSKSRPAFKSNMTIKSTSY